MDTIKLEVERFRTKKQQQLFKMLNDKTIRKEVNKLIKDAINPFVPMKSGALRRSAIVTHKSISWGRGLEYARYQYGGQVYGPNYPGIEEGGEPGWRSPKGKGSKHPTGRELGVPGIAVLHPVWQLINGKYTRPQAGTVMTYKFGYTTPGTQHHWDKAFEYQVKQQVNIEATRLLKKECKARGLKV